MYQRIQYVCPKCVNQHFEADRFKATGGAFAKLFDVQNKRFSTVTCTQCGFTELYRQVGDKGMDILDFLMG